jgi:hypothetical protein
MPVRRRRPLVGRLDRKGERRRRASSGAAELVTIGSPPSPRIPCPVREDLGTNGATRHR